jgi:RNA ligase (TIGR02306 family)
MSETKSTHKCEVVPLMLEKHPNADTLSVCRVFGYTVCTGTEQWKGHEVAAYIPPDSLVDTRRSEFDFLKQEGKYYADSETASTVIREEHTDYARIRVKKLRGVLSYGMLCPAPAGAKLGDDVAEQLGVLHYEAPIACAGTGGEAEKPPEGHWPKYDVDSFQRYAQQVFHANEPVICTEKIHGSSGRWVFHNGRMYCGSRTEWKREFPSADSERTGAQNLWWRAMYHGVNVEDWCRAHPDIVVYGEVYGSVQKGFNYGLPKDVSIAVFDLRSGSDWVDHHAARLAAPELPWVPTVAECNYDFNKLLALAEGKTLLNKAQHMREGIVVKPLHERSHDEIGRVQLKIVSASFLAK